MNNEDQQLLNKKAARYDGAIAALAPLTGSPATPNSIRQLGLAECYLRTAANFIEKGWLKEAYMEAAHAQRLLKEVIEETPENE